MLSLKIKIKVIIKKIIYFNFITKFFGRILIQRFNKSVALAKDFPRLKASLWVDWNKELFDSWAKRKEKNLYIESVNFYLNFAKERKKIISGLPISGGIRNARAGGSSNEVLLYFLVRLINAKNVLETGVSAGSSSRCILEGLKKNENGRLFSSDLATVLNKNQVGILVNQNLRKNWFLTNNGDKKNIPIIFKKNQNFDLIYYDSEKSYASKKWFHNEIIKKTLPKIMIYDDIDRNSFFPECVNSFGCKYRIFGNAGVIFFDKNYF
jgi:hypothetical protein